MNKLTVTEHKSAQDFLRVIQEPLMAHEVLNNLLLGLARRLVEAAKPSAQPPVLMSVTDAGNLRAAVLMTPPWPAVLYASAVAVPEELSILVEALSNGGDQVSGCWSSKPIAAEFAQLWHRHTGQSVKVRTSLRLYELHTVRSLPKVSGQARVAAIGDLDLAADWTDKFAIDVGYKTDPPAARAKPESLIHAGQLLIWEDGGVPVSIASTCRPLQTTVAIGSVYTPPQYRRRGYASACVAELSRRQLSTGWKSCSLFTDLANPTSNSIYQKIGYVPLADYDEYSFSR